MHVYFNGHLRKILKGTVAVTSPAVLLARVLPPKFKILIYCKWEWLICDRLKPLHIFNICTWAATLYVTVFSMAWTGSRTCFWNWRSSEIAIVSEYHLWIKMRSSHTNALFHSCAFEVLAENFSHICWFRPHWTACHLPVDRPSQVFTLLTDCWKGVLTEADWSQLH